MAASTTASPETYKALVFNSTSEPLQLVTKPLPAPAQGQVVVKVLASYILPYVKTVLSGGLPYTLAAPFVPSSSAIARVHAAGPDATALRAGQLVLADMTLRGRDDPDSVVLMGLEGTASPSLMTEWAAGSFAEYAVFPLENVFPLDEARLLGELRYSVDDLVLMRICQVPFGGLAKLDVRPGETVVVCPATGRFGGAAVLTAVAMGARVIAAGRNKAVLERLEQTLGGDAGRVKPVVLTGDLDTDKAALKAAVGVQGADCYVDFSPPQAAKSTHVRACFDALRPGGRVVFNGGSLGTVDIPYLELVLKNLTIYGRFMYEPEDTRRLIKMAEAGLLPLGTRLGIETTGKFKLEQFQEALDLAEKDQGWGKQVVFAP